MIDKQKAAAFYSPWKFKIERLSKNDIVFLYQSGVGIVAYGEASGKLEKHSHQDKPENKDEEYSMKLNKFKKITPALSASEIKKITGVNHVFMGTMFGLDFENGKKIKEFLDNRSNIAAGA